ncbi:MAG TPA: DUF882 domain-containing protein [Hyphomicrobiaceae bacterium]
MVLTGRFLWLFASLGASAAVVANAEAADDSRSLAFFHTHTQESTTVTFRRGNSYVSAGLEQLNHFLRDWRDEQSTSMDPRLFDIIWEVHRAVGSRSPVHIISAYRSPQTNQALRSRSRAVSEHSQHMLGRAMDIRFPDVDPGRVREAAMRVQQGGVGFYPGANFVHVDVGNVRAWPRMSREQLAQLFPDGKTVHLPPDGKPLAGYEQARAEILSRGSTGSAEPGLERRSLWASLFGRRNDGLSPVPATAEQVILPQALAYAPLPPRRPDIDLEATAAPPAGTVTPADLASLRIVFSKSQLAAGPAPDTPVVMARVATQPFPVGTTLIAASEESIATAQTQFGDPKMEAARRALARALAERAKGIIEQDASATTASIPR